VKGEFIFVIPCPPLAEVSRLEIGTEVVPDQSEAARLGNAPYYENYGYINTSTLLVSPACAEFHFGSKERRMPGVAGIQHNCHSRAGGNPVLKESRTGNGLRGSSIAIVKK
jgi:hypothetical protein